MIDHAEAHRKAKEAAQRHCAGQWYTSRDERMRAYWWRYNAVYQFQIEFQKLYPKLNW